MADNVVQLRSPMHVHETTSSRVLAEIRTMKVGDEFTSCDILARLPGAKEDVISASLSRFAHKTNLIDVIGRITPQGRKRVHHVYRVVDLHCEVVVRGSVKEVLSRARKSGKSGYKNTPLPLLEPKKEYHKVKVNNYQAIKEQANVIADKLLAIAIEVQDLIALLLRK